MLKLLRARMESSGVRRFCGRLQWPPDGWFALGAAALKILIANRDVNAVKSNLAKKRGWWTPMFLAAGKYFLNHVSRQTQARRNISHHYDLSNELFGLFLDDTMTYSCAVFKSDKEDLKTAQMRKISLLIDKVRVEKNNEVLEIECVCGCRYTGITLSTEQLKYVVQ